MKIHLATAAALALLLVGCAQTEPRSQLYFDTHIDEARQIVEGCRDGSVRNAECDNADRAVSPAKARKRTRKFLGDGNAYTPR